MKDIRSAENAILVGREKFLRRQREFMQRWMKPLVDTQAATWWNNLPPEVKGQLRTLKPQATADFEKQFFGGGG